MHKFKITIVATLALIFVMKWMLPAPEKNQEEINQFWFNKTFASADYDIVFAGDSRVYRGISTKEIVATTKQNLRAINLGYSSAGLSKEYLDFVISKFDPKAKNKLLVIGVTPHSLTFEAFKNESLIENKKVAKSHQLRYRYLSSFLKNFAPYTPRELAYSYRDNYIEKYNEDGWIASSYRIPDTNFALASYRKTFSDYQVTRKEETEFLNKIKNERHKGIQIILFRPPTTDSMTQLEDSLSGFNENEFKKLAIKNGAIWLDFKNSQFTSYDGSHLVENSARKLSRMIGKKLKKMESFEL